MGHNEHGKGQAAPAVEARRRAGAQNEAVAVAAGAAVAALATRQHGVVSRRQQRALGLSDRTIESRLASGWLQPIFRGVFAVGHRAYGRRGLMLAAVLACGRDAVVSHGSAAELLGSGTERRC